MSAADAPNDGMAKTDQESCPLQHEQRVAHLAAGYENSQSVVRFLDTKAAAIVAGIPLVLGILAGILNWLYDASQWRALTGAARFWPAVLFITVLLVLVMILLRYAVLAVVAAFSAISPRNTGKALPSVLFPYRKPIDGSVDEFEARVQVFLGTPQQSDVVEDYRRQLLRMGEIVAEKIDNVATAVWYFKRIIVVSALVLLWIVFAAVASWLSVALRIGHP